MPLRVVHRSDSLLFEQADDSTDLLILFSGWNAGFLSRARFHFMASTRHLQVNKLYLRDCFGLWYHGGLAGHTTSISSTADFLAGFLTEHRFQRVRMLGVSAGGYAALLFGALLGVDSIHALSPRTFLDPVNRQRHGDTRLEAGFEQLYQAPGAEPAFFDLAEVLQRYPPRAWPCEVHYDPEAPIDRAHAEHLAGCLRIRLVPHPGTGHAVAVALMTDPRFIEGVLAGG